MIADLKRLAFPQSNYALIKQALRNLQGTVDERNVVRVFRLFVRGLFGVSLEVIMRDNETEDDALDRFFEL